MRLAVVGLLVLALMLTAVGSATAVPVKPCGNYGFPEGHTCSKPIFTSEEIVGAGVSDIITKVARCRTARRMVRRFWAGRRGLHPRLPSRIFSVPGATARRRVLSDALYGLAERVVRFNFGA